MRKSNMKYHIGNFGQTPSNTQMLSDIEEIQTRAKFMMGFGLLLAFSTAALLLKYR
jgi:hypothetical protein